MLFEFLSRDSRRVLINAKPDSVSVSLDTVPSFAFDLEGRLIGAYWRERTLRRGLDNRLVEKRWLRQGNFKDRVVRELPDPERRAFFNEVYDTMRNIGDELDRGDFEPISSPRSDPASVDAVRRAFRPVAMCNFEQLEADRTRYLATYMPVSILPPDRYMALVLQATEGCSHNRCTFCGFYRDRLFHVKTEAEFRAHIEAVKSYFGQGLSLRKSIFLADANALVIPQDRLVRLFDIINEAFTVVPADRPYERPVLRGIYSFIDAFTTRRKTQRDFEELRARNLHRIYVGLESGCDALLRFVNKPGLSTDALDLVATLKEARLQVGVIVLVGLGGDFFAEAHVRETIRAVNAMHLGAGDLVYLSIFQEQLGTEYGARAVEAGIRSLTRLELHEQMQALRAGFDFGGAARPPQVAVYDIREFIY